MKNYGVLQIEPTDFCNLRCVMCSPHAAPRPHVHGDTPKGYLDFEVHKKIIDDIVRDGLQFDHIIYEWIGDPMLHPKLLEMIEYAVENARHHFGYFRFDTNAIRLTRDRSEKLTALVARHPGLIFQLVFSLDSVTPATYKRVKGIDAFNTVMQNVRYLLECRRKIDLAQSKLNIEFQFVLQDGNHDEAKAFIDLWTAELNTIRQPHAWDEIMIKRRAIGVGGPAQDASDALYEATIARFGIDHIGQDYPRVQYWKSKYWGAAPTVTPARLSA